jgi:type I restriction enzyme S subunit
MKQGWEIKSLGEIADVEYGFTDKSTEEGDYRYVRITDIDDNGELISTEKKYLKHSKEAASFLLQDNDLLMARTGATFAKVLLYEDVEPSVFASYLIRIKFKEKIDNKLYWYFSKTKAYWDQANSLASGAAQPHFNGAALKQVIFSYPKSLPEQQRIVSILDETFAAIAKAKANAEQNLKNAKELLDVFLHKYFTNKEEGWEEKKLKDVAEYFNGLTYSPKDVSDNGTIVLRSSNIQNDKLDFADIVRVTSAIKEKIIVRDGDVLMCSRNGSKRLVGKTAPIENLPEQMTFGTFMMIVRSSYNPYLLWFFKSLDFKKQISGGENTMINQITRYMLDDIVVSFPPLEKQMEIVKQLDAIYNESQKLESIYLKKIDDLEELKKSVLQKAFAGELKTEKLETV